MTDRFELRCIHVVQADRDRCDWASSVAGFRVYTIFQNRVIAVPGAAQRAPGRTRLARRASLCFTAFTSTTYEKMSVHVAMRMVAFSRGHSAAAHTVLTNWNCNSDMASRGTCSAGLLHLYHASAGALLMLPKKNCALRAR